MHAKNQVWLVRKTIRRSLLFIILGILCFAFNLEHQNVVHAKGFGYENPVLIGLKDFSAFEDVENAILEAIATKGYLLAWPGTSLHLDPESIKVSGQWGTAYLNYLSLKDKSPTNERPSLILLHQVNGEWAVHFPIYSEASEFNDWLSSLPVDLLTADQKTERFIPQLLYLKDYGLLRTPWKVNSVLAGGPHDGYARDFYVGGSGSGIGAEVVAAASGSVVYLKEDSSDTTDNCTVSDMSCYKKANMVVINHGGYYTWYVHLKQLSVPITVGQWVDAGMKIGEEGNTGYSTGPHLHFAVSLCAEQGANMFWYHNCVNTEIFSFSGIPGTSQTWASGSTLPPSTPCDASTIPLAYTKCAEEGSGNQCNFSGLKTVYYGANSCYAIEQKSDGVECINENFGGDPLPGVRKACYIDPSSICNPNADQVALYEHADHRGSCVVKAVGNYPGPGSMGIADQSVSSVKVGSNVQLTLCRETNYGVPCELFTANDSNLSDNSIGNDQTSSAKVEPRSCPFVFGTVRLFNGASCSPSSIDVTLGLTQLEQNSFNDMAESIAIPSGWSARLYQNNSENANESRCFSGTDTNLLDDTFANGGTVGNQATWVRVYNNSSCYLKPGDANGDGSVDGRDYVIWTLNYAQAVNRGSSDGDFDNNRYVDGRDYFIWMTNYGT